MTTKTNDMTEGDVFSFLCIINQLAELLRSILVFCGTFMINLLVILYLRTEKK